ncbi:MAG: hypothetical protein AAFY99_09820 [Pseudomonadota bacterium]
MVRLVKKIFAAGLIASALGAVSAQAESITGIEGAYDVAFAGCGWYVVLGCSQSFNGSARTMNNLGGPFAGGGAGLKVANTNEYPNFRNGWYCVVDGPYFSQGEAQSIAWAEAVPDAYVKNGC